MKYVHLLVLPLGFSELGVGGGVSHMSSELFTKVKDLETVVSILVLRFICHDTYLVKPILISVVYFLPNHA